MRIHELNKVRDITLALPEVNEKKSYGGAIWFFLPNKKTICYFHDNYMGDCRVVLWCPAYSDLKKDLIRNKPEQFFQPYTSSAGHFSKWLGIYLDTTDENSVDWKLLSKILEDSYRKVAPKRLINKLELND